MRRTDTVLLESFFTVPMTVGYRNRTGASATVDRPTSMKSHARRHLGLLLLLSVATCCNFARSAQVEECEVTETGEETCRTSSSDMEECVDKHDLCDFWAGENECDANPGYMHLNCPVSCGTCASGGDDDENFSTDVSEAMGEKVKLQRMTTEYGQEQVVEGDMASATLLVIKETIMYMENFVLRENPTHQLSAETINKCLLRDELCSFWAAIGECDKNPAFMITTCAPSCRSCHMIDLNNRCPIDPNAKPALIPGSLNTMFERIVSEAADGYSVTVHSGPPADPADSTTTRDVALSEGNDLTQPPWIVTMDGFLTEEECDHLIKKGYESGYARSDDVGEEKFDGTFDSVKSEGRTSENAWCSDDSGCRDDPTVKRIIEKMSRVMGIDADNMEDLQILRYEEGQRYHSHHDYIENQRDRQNGPRILTFFLYLSDVEAGGGTRFTALDPMITVEPKKGRALLWPSVLNSKPKDRDPRMDHEALPVEKGTKFAANGWVHLFDERGPQKRGCT